MNFTTLIDVKVLAEVMPDVVVLDCRFDLAAPAAGRQAYLAGHIPGAHFIDLNTDLAGPVSATSGRHPLPEPAALAQRFAALGIGTDSQVVAYDEANGAFAARAWWLLRWLGHPRVAVLDGGLRAWVAAGGATEAAHGPVDQANRSARASSADSIHAAASGVSPTVDGGAVVNAAEVWRALGDRTRLVVDARTAERFAGTVEPIDPVAGHIPGAVNFPFSGNLGPDGRFLSPAELRRVWESRLAETAPDDAILMCGSGVTACHNLLALEAAGLPGAKLYAGSWSEWIRDPARPVAKAGEA